MKAKAFTTIAVAKEKLTFGTLGKPTKERNFGAMATFKFDRHTCTQKQTQPRMTNKKREKERSWRDERATLKKRIVASIIVRFFFHILGEMDRLVHVASQGSLILGY